jgi:predicted cobalt transporter CbtA
VQIDWSFLDSVNWAEVAWLSAIAFLATLIGDILAFRHKLWAPILAGVLFAAGYVFLAYFPHEGLVPGFNRPAEPQPPVPTGR